MALMVGGGAESTNIDYLRCLKSYEFVVKIKVVGFNKFYTFDLKSIIIPPTVWPPDAKMEVKIYIFGILMTATFFKLGK